MTDVPSCVGDLWSRMEVKDRPGIDPDSRLDVFVLGSGGAVDHVWTNIRDVRAVNT